MTVNLNKTITDDKDINERYAWGMDREAWNSTVLLPMYLGTIFPRTTAVRVNQKLMRNDLRSFATLLRLEHAYDNTTGE